MVYAIQAGVFLIKTIFGLYLIVVMLRFMMQFIRADFRNPISQFIFKVTNPPLVPMRRVIPGLFGIDMSSLVLMYVVQVLEIVLVGLLIGLLPIPNIMMLAVVELAQLLIYIYLFSILIMVIVSWVNPGAYNPIVAFIHTIAEPILSPVRRRVPAVSGFDFSVLIVSILLVLINMTFIAALKHTIAPSYALFG